MGYLLKESTIVSLAHQLRSSNQQIIFTHGTFDLFHAGHSYFLNQSKRAGDILVVGVDSDKKVRNFKGIPRPVIPQEQRLDLVANHKAVDFVFLIDQLIDQTSNNEEQYYVSLYERLFPTMVTFGRNFDYKAQFTKRENRILGVGYKEIPKVFKNTPSTTGIISKIRAF